MSDILRFAPDSMINPRVSSADTDFATCADLTVWSDRVLKRLGKNVGVWRALPMLLSYRVMRRIVGNDRAFSAASEHLAVLPGHVGIYTRQVFYRETLAALGEDVSIGLGCLFSKTQAEIGDRVYLGRNCVIGWAQIENDVVVADNVQILSGRHHHGQPTDELKLTTWRDQPQQFSPVRIGRGAWIGAGAIIMADVEAGAVIGAGAVVVKPVEAGACVAGVPAKSIRSNRSERLAA